MEHESMDVEQLASLLQRDAREVAKMASRGHLPGQKVGAKWRFSSAEINHWIESQMHAYTEQELLALEQHPAATMTSEPLLVSSLMSETTTAVPLRAGTKGSVLRELSKLAEQSWGMYDADALLAAIKQREEMGSTAFNNGVAIPHPIRPLSEKAQAEALIAYGRTASGIPFSAGAGGLTDLFFLVACRDHKTHLRVMARLSRLMLKPTFADELRAADTAPETLAVLEAMERDLVGL